MDFVSLDRHERVHREEVWQRVAEVSVAIVLVGVLPCFAPVSFREPRRRIRLGPKYVFFQSSRECSASVRSRYAMLCSVARLHSAFWRGNVVAVETHQPR